MMGFFSGKKEEEQTLEKSQDSAKQSMHNSAVSGEMIKIPTHNVSVIKENFNIKAEIEGQGSLIIGGHFEGIVKVDDTLFVEKGARFSGTVDAKNVKISGDFEGTINSIAVEITKSGRLNGTINANKTFLGGFVNGVIKSIETIEISSTGIIDTKECKSKQIKIEGNVEGRVVASELLEVTSGGSVKGDIITKGIRTEQGGSIIGNIQTYDESIHSQDIPLNSDEESNKIDPEVAKLIDIDPNNLEKYAKKEEKEIKRIPADKK